MRVIEGLPAHKRHRRDALPLHTSVLLRSKSGGPGRVSVISRVVGVPRPDNAKLRVAACLWTNAGQDILTAPRPLGSTDSVTAGSGRDRRPRKHP
jgi:hypothetical protein